MSTTKQIQKKPKLHYLLKSLEPGEKVNLSKSLGVTIDHFYRLTKNVSSLRIDQLEIIVPFLENKYGPDEITGFHDLYIPKPDEVCM